MRRKIILGAAIFISLIFISFVSAFDTPIKVKTLADHKVSIFAYETGKLTYENSYHLTADIKGEVSLVHSSSSSKIDIMVKVTKDGQKVFLTRFDGYDAGKQIYIRLDNEEENGFYNPDAQKIENTTNVSVASRENQSVENKTEEVAATSTSQDSQDTITGKVVDGNDSSGLPKFAYYIIGFFVLSFIVLLGIRFYGRSNRNGLNYDSGNLGGFSKGTGPLTPTVRKAFPESRKNDLSKPNTYYSGVTQNPRNRPQPTTNVVQSPKVEDNTQDDEIKNIEQQIKDLRIKENRIKDKERIKKTQAQLEADKRELERLKRNSGEQ